MWTWIERRPVVFDVLAAVIGFVFFAGLDVTRTGPSTIAVDAIYALAVAFRRAPGLALTIAWIGAVTQLVILPSFINGNVLIVVVIAATSLSQSPTVRRLGLASSIGGGLIAGVKLVLITGDFLPAGHHGTEESLTRIIYFLGVTGVVAAALMLFWLFGAVTRVRRAFASERLVRLESDRERLRAELRVAQETERMRITREMHDAIGHSLAVVIAQSDGARYAIAKNPAAAADALAVINRSARDALDDVSALLAVLQSSDAHEGSPGVADLEGLVENMASSGLTVALNETGDRVGLPTSADLAVYRVLQEALTNALKHGGPGTKIDLWLSWRGDAVDLHTLTSEADGRRLIAPRTPTPHTGSAQGRGAGSGYGVAGMIERVRLLGGTVEAGFRTDGPTGYEIRAAIPYGQLPGDHSPMSGHSSRPEVSS
ncbi:sensor histidine kinase [Frondihabitans cladoniiphilus]|uniref:histidine kinase n=1 Tax=Frondihabitans cladoniiphilus TaxID=715785 RepID=A0ABP8W897_9MICO